MAELLYKVSEPRNDWTFEPRPFWRAGDWSFSDDRPREGLIEDRVLYAAPFDEINIHLLPPVWRLRVWLDDEARNDRLRGLGYTWEPGTRALIFAHENDRAAIESFAPTVFGFDASGFQRTPTNEFISRTPQTAVTAETVPFGEARDRWKIAVTYVAQPDALVDALRSARIDHQIQT